MKNFVVLDLDGTLLDTLLGITRAMNEGLKFYNYPYSYYYETIKTFIWNGARKLFLRATKKEKFYDELEIQYKKFCEFYEKYQYVSKPYPEVVETLKELNKRDIKLIIYSNKPNFLLQKVVERVLPNIDFLEVLGQVDEYPNKPDVTLLNEVLKEHNLSHLNGIYVGDSLTDNQTAINAQMDFLFLTYGYSKPVRPLDDLNITVDTDLLEGICNHDAGIDVFLIALWKSELQGKTIAISSFI